MLLLPRAACKFSHLFPPLCLPHQISPPSLIVTDGLPQGVRRNYSWLLPGAPVKEAALPPVDSPQLLSKEQLLAEAGSISRRLSGGAGGAPVPRKISAELQVGGCGSVVERATQGERCSAGACGRSPSCLPRGHCLPPCVQAAFAPYPRLLSFVAATPPAPLFAQIERYAQRLSAHISDLPPPVSLRERESVLRLTAGTAPRIPRRVSFGQPCTAVSSFLPLPPPNNAQLPASAADVPVGGWSWTSTGEALRMLGELSTARVSLSLLEQSGISRAVGEWLQ